MFDLSSVGCYLAAGLIFSIHRNVCADTDLSKIFGKNINNEEAWAKLFELEDCPKPQPWADTIIMVNESLSAGAKFMDNPNVTSRYECEFECCYKLKEGCNIAVYTAEQKHCYLFNCGRPSKCRFDQHAGYTVSSITNAITPGKPVPTKTPTPQPPAASTTPAPPKQLHLLDGCRPKIDKCVTANTECSNTGFCICKDGYHPKNGVCRENCIHGLQFECTNGDPKFAHPDCIAVYDMCDGTPQCPDGSDEKDCDKGRMDWSKLGGMSSLKAKIEEYMKEHPDAAKALGKKVVGPEATTEKSEPALKNIKAMLGETKPSKSDKHEDQLSALSPAIAHSTSASTAAPADSTALPAAAVESVNNTDSAGDKEAVLAANKAEAMADGSRSAVIALSLSLTLTMVLVVYLGCRYKKAKRRVGRHGKPLSGSEVDYLIDGMYL